MCCEIATMVAKVSTNSFAFEQQQFRSFQKQLHSGIHKLKKNSANASRTSNSLHILNKSKMTQKLDDTMTHYTNCVEICVKNTKFTMILPINAKLNIS